MRRNIVIPAAVTAVLLLVISGVRESRYTYETQPGGCVQVQGGGFAGTIQAFVPVDLLQYPGGMSMGTGTGGGLLFWVDQGGPELELTAEFPDRAVPVTVSLGELGGTDGTPVFVPADENYYKVWVDVSAQVMRTDVYRVDRRTGIRELWNSTYATEEVQAVPEAVPVET